MLRVQDSAKLTPKRIGELITLDTRYRFIVSLVARQAHSHEQPPDADPVDLRIRQINRDVMAESLIVLAETITDVQGELGEWSAPLGGTLAEACGPIATRGALAAAMQSLPILHAFKAFVPSFIAWARDEGQTGPSKDVLSRVAEAFARPTVSMDEDAATALVDQVLATSLARHGNSDRALQRVDRADPPMTSTPAMKSAPAVRTPQEGVVSIHGVDVSDTGSPVASIANDSFEPA